MRNVSPLSKTYLNRTNNTSYKEIYTARQSLTKLKHQPELKPNQAYQNGLLIGNSVTQQGVFLQKHGLIFMTLQQPPQLLSPYLFVFPDSTHCYFTIKNNELHGHCVFLNQTAFIQCNSFKMGKLQGHQYSYVPSIRQFTKSLYKNNNLVKIVESGFCPQDKNPIAMFDNAEVYALINRIIDLDFTVKNVDSIKIPGLRYFGETYDDQPNGYGAILSLSEMFCGQFRDGLLEGLGRIRFENGDVIQGYFEKGNCTRFGKFVSNQQAIYKAGQTTITHQEYLRLVQNLSSLQERVSTKFIIPYYDKINNYYKTLISNYSDQSGSKLIRQSSRLISNNGTQTQSEPSPAYSRNPSDMPLLRVDSIQSPYDNLIVVHRDSYEKLPDTPISRLAQNRTISKENSIVNLDETEDIAEEVSAKAVSNQFAKGTPKFFEAKIGDKQAKSERVFRKTRQERLQGREVMDVIAESSKEMTAESDKLQTLVKKISRSPTKARNNDIYRISFRN